MTTPTRFYIAPNWTQVEDEQICRSWIQLSSSNYVQNIENHTFWPKVKKHFDSNMVKNNVSRTCNDLLSRWNLIDEKVMKYLAAISQVQRVMNRVTIQDQFESANQFYKAMEHEDFFYFHCYNILCNQPKWQGIVGGPNTQANQVSPTAHNARKRGNPIPITHMQQPMPHMQNPMQHMQRPMQQPMPHMQNPMQYMQRPMQQMQQPMASMPHMAPPMQQMQQPMASMPHMAPPMQQMQPMQHMASNPPPTPTPTSNIQFLAPNTPTAYAASTSKSNKAPKPIAARPATTTQTVAPRPTLTTPAASTSKPIKATKTTTARPTSKSKKTSKIDAARQAAADQTLAAGFARLDQDCDHALNRLITAIKPASARLIAQSTSRIIPVTPLAPTAKPSKGKNNVAARPAVASAACPTVQASRPAIQTARPVGQSAPLAPINGNLLTSRPTTTQQKRKAEAKSTPKLAKKIAAKKAQPLPPVIQEPPKPVLTEKEKQLLELNAKKTSIAQTLKDSELMSKDLSSIANPVEREAMRKLQFEAMKRMSQRRRLRKAEQALAAGENK